MLLRVKDFPEAADMKEVEDSIKSRLGPAMTPVFYWEVLIFWIAMTPTAVRHNPGWVDIAFPTKEEADQARIGLPGFTVRHTLTTVEKVLRRGEQEVLIFASPSASPSTSPCKCFF
jgi:hypothetical protein